MRTTWSFSAFTVLVYYAITNLAALRLTSDHRRFPRWIPAAGLAGCLGLVFWVERRIWLIGLALLAVGSPPTLRTDASVAVLGADRSQEASAGTTLSRNTRSQISRSVASYRSRS